MANNIELRHLRHFVALAEELHFGRTAKRCNISQPPFSVSIRQLEDLLGLVLVERTSHDVRLTAAGSAFYEEAHKALAQVRQSVDLAVRVASGSHGTLNVGFFGSMLHRGLDRAVRRFEAEFPEVELRLLELSTVDQIPALQRRQIHYGFIHSSALPAGLASLELLREPFVLCLPAGHPACARPVRSLADLRNEPFILFARAFSPAYYDQVIAMCVAAGFHPDIRHEGRHWLTVVSCVSKGMGITLVPRSMMAAGLPDVEFVAIDTGPVESVVRGAWLESDQDHAALRNWRSIVESEIAA